MIISTLPLIFVGSNVENEEFLEEIKLMKRIGQHPHIVSLVGCITTNTPFCLIVEYCLRGDLLNYLRKERPKVRTAEDLVLTKTQSFLFALAY